MGAQLHKRRAAGEYAAALFDADAAQQHARRDAETILLKIARRPTALLVIFVVDHARLTTIKAAAVSQFLVIAAVYFQNDAIIADGALQDGRRLFEITEIRHAEIADDVQISAELFRLHGDRRFGEAHWVAQRLRGYHARIDPLHLYLQAGWIVAQGYTGLFDIRQAN